MSHTYTCEREQTDTKIFFHVTDMTIDDLLELSRVHNIGELPGAAEVEDRLTGRETLALTLIGNWKVKFGSGARAGNIVRLTLQVGHLRIDAVTHAVAVRLAAEGQGWLTPRIILSEDSKHAFV